MNLRDELEAVHAETRALERELRRTQPSQGELELHGMLRALEERKHSAAAEVLLVADGRRKLHQRVLGAEAIIAMVPVVIFAPMVLMFVMLLAPDWLERHAMLLAASPAVITGARIGVASVRWWWRERRLQKLEASITPPR